MPTIYRENGFRFFFYTHEGNEPAQVHVIGKGGEMKVWLNPIQISKVYNLSSKDQRAVLLITSKNSDFFKKEWSKYHESNS